MKAPHCVELAWKLPFSTWRYRVLTVCERNLLKRATLVPDAIHTVKIKHCTQYLESVFYKGDIQATPAMSTSRISILPLMSKWFFIPNIFSLYFFAFQLRLCRKPLTWSNGYLEVIFHALDVFSIIFATVYGEVEVGTHMGAILSASAMYMY